MSRSRKVPCRALVPTRRGGGDEYVPAGTLGEVLARRHLPSDEKPLLLVKWRGISGPSSHPAREVEILPHDVR